MYVTNGMHTSLLRASHLSNMSLGNTSTADVDAGVLDETMQSEDLKSRSTASFNANNTASTTGRRAGTSKAGAGVGAAEVLEQDWAAVAALTLRAELQASHD